MRSPQTKLIALLVLWLTIIIFQVTWFTEDWRMAQGGERLEEVQVSRGAMLYAENCVICHGPIGEGVVGPPLLRQEWREGTDLEMEATREFLERTISRGRGGSSDTKWVFNEDGTIESHTAMPVFGKDNGGPFNEQQVEDLAVFLMAGDFADVGAHIPGAAMKKVVRQPDPNDPDNELTVEVNIDYTDLPEAKGVSQEINDAGRQLMLDRACLTCHVVGDYGRPFGPNLADVGNWTTPEFLREWLTNTENVANRMPTVWWGNNERIEVPVDWQGEHKTVMTNPVTGLGATEEDIDILVEYLSGLKP